MKEITITIPSSTEFVGPVVKFFDTLFVEKGIKEPATTNVTTSVIEAIGNAITHGNKGDISKTIDIFIKLHRKKIIIEVQDHGEGFDYADLPDPLAPENLLKLSGRGIFFMKSLMDSVQFKCNGNGSKVIMEKMFQQSLE
ncbi:putative anti-sigma regulatory factor, serine/threonine protein kinase [Candidatus Vecturithrix granuli]|uniref:Putative anti-sigma regulatory factor, serine/threonine protein kinase n=1 Tax=Vecturithrix granuli TaxID=1499967 RepID=A0A081C0B3_VECG1|nr:putative anti-sigma regulatory factor, serine/threonine protein kinase [Candidatus Vecturithrix granuli]